jgi:hypothetical protein
LTSATLRAAIGEALTDKPCDDIAAMDVMDEWLDYWMGSGTDLPCYHIDKATARLLPEQPGDVEGQARYEVEVTVRNEGTGRMPVPIQLETARHPVEGRLWVGAGETAIWKTIVNYLPGSVRVNGSLNWRGQSRVLETWILAKPYYDEQTKSWIGSPTAQIAMEQAGRGEH